MTLTDQSEESASSNTTNMQPTLEQEGQALGLALREAVWQAQEQGRLHCGVLQCAQLLEIDPFNVMMCVIPMSIPEDVSGIIERTLIEAFCHEYQIRLIKVDSVNKLRKVLEGRAEEEATQTRPQPSSSASSPSSSSSSSSEASAHSSELELNGIPPQATPNPAGVRVHPGRPANGAATAVWELCSCVMMQYPESGETSVEEETVAHYYKKTTSTASMVTGAVEDGCSAFVALPDD